MIGTRDRWNRSLDSDFVEQPLFDWIGACNTSAIVNALFSNKKSVRLIRLRAVKNDQMTSDRSWVNAIRTQPPLDVVNAVDMYNGSRDRLTHWLPSMICYLLLQSALFQIAWSKEHMNDYVFLLWIVESFRSWTRYDVRDDPTTVRRSAQNIFETTCKASQSFDLSLNCDWFKVDAITDL